jgi:hypothetical protein
MPSRDCEPGQANKTPRKSWKGPGRSFAAPERRQDNGWLASTPAVPRCGSRQRQCGVVHSHQKTGCGASRRTAERHFELDQYIAEVREPLAIILALVVLYMVANPRITNDRSGEKIALGRCACAWQTNRYNGLNTGQTASATRPFRVRRR